MRISIFGLGRVGAVSGACIADAGHEVIAIDTDIIKVKRLREGRSPIAEPGLDELIASGTAKGSLKTTVDCEEAVMNSDMSLICVGAPSNNDGSPRLDYIRSACSQIGVALKKKGAFHSIVLRSAVVPGTARAVAIPVLEDCSGKTAGVDFGFGNNPAFLREGTAIHDYFNPPKIVIGALDSRTSQAISALYKGINAPEIITEIDIAEGVKYAGNAWHALKAGFVSEIGNIMKTGAVAESLVTLLRTAHAAEQEFIDSIREYLETVDCLGVRERIRSHLVEMQWQVRLLEACLEFQGNGGALPDIAAVRSQAAETSRAGLLAIKRFKIALYKSIIAEARKQQAPEVLQSCREILEQEREMAEWIEDHHSELSPRVSLVPSNREQTRG